MPKGLSRAVASQADPLGSPEHVERALHGFFRIMQLWNVGNTHARRILGQPPPRIFSRWKRGHVEGVPLDTLRRIGYVSGIWKALQVVYGEPAQADRWPTVPNRALGGQTPLERMAAGDVTDLAAVRQYLEHARAPWS